MASMLYRGRRAGRGLLLITLAGLALAGCDGRSVADAASNALSSALSAIGLGSEPAADKAPDQGRRGQGQGQGKGGGKGRVHLVELVDARVGNLNITSIYNGTLRARRTVRVHTQEEGRVARVVPYEGDRVEAGAALLDLDATLLRAELDKAAAVRRESEANLARLSGLRQRRMVGEDEYLRAATALEVAQAEEAVLRTRLGYMQLAAPFRGVVSERLVEPGDVVGRHTHVLTIIDPESMVIDIAASELLLPDLGVGDAVSVRIDALGPQDLAGRVVRIYPELDARTRQGRLEVALDPLPDGARAGQFARVTFDVNARDRTVIPFGALRRDRDSEYVFVVGDDRKARRVEVRSGRRLADEVEILQGLARGDRVVLRGFLGLNEGMTVTAAPGPGETQGGAQAAVQRGGQG